MLIVSCYPMYAARGTTRDEGETRIDLLIARTSEESARNGPKNAQCMLGFTV